MQHDWQAFAASIPALLKTSGDSGDSGDSTKKDRVSGGLAVPTSAQEVSPLENEWGQDRKTSGDNKTSQIQLLSDGVPTVSTVPTKFWEDIFPNDIPAEWRDGYAAFSAMTRPEDFPEYRWQQAIADGRTFLLRWGAEAFRLGWTATDLFGVSPLAPWPRVGMLGLVLLLNGDEVTVLNADAATILGRSGSALKYRRHMSRDGRACVWVIGGAA
ncbi:MULTISPECIES: hypothetical protein [unclassified Afipia]|uniref:hypothetical protein n=1 Tax=unclassified Afipia TaxID=2642050 RepID=UPI00046401BC|nr:MULTISPECIES: hypothetical protein [unclassified Afipia]